MLAVYTYIHTQAQASALVASGSACLKGMSWAMTGASQFSQSTPGRAAETPGEAQSGARLVTLLPVVNMLQGPQDEAPVGSQAIYGQTLTLERTEGDWLCVRSADAYTGWVPRSSMQHYVEDAAATPAQIASLSANVYREPDVKAHAPLLHLPWEAMLTVTSAVADPDDRWLEVRLVTGELAYVQRGDVSFERRSLSEDEMLELAPRFLGITYTWGGTSSFGFDCSGFTQMLLRQRGIVMPRDAHMQATWEGSYDIPPNAIRGGDLLFFDEGGAGVTHTGIALDGSRFLHASTRNRPGVQIGELHDDHWRRLLVRQRRVG
jgi:hypothetical protein